MRASRDEGDEKKKINVEYDYTDHDTQAIVSHKVYRLTNTDITTMEKETDEHKKKIDQLSAILNNNKKLFHTIKADLKQLKKTIGDERRTVIEEEIEELTFNIEVTVA